jgi:hypothetical protein
MKHLFIPVMVIWVVEIEWVSISQATNFLRDKRARF